MLFRKHGPSPGNGVVKVLCDSADPKCDGEGRGEEDADCAE